MFDIYILILYTLYIINHNRREIIMGNIARDARATEVMNKVKGQDPFAFNVRFLGYNEGAEGIFAQQREADRKLKQIQAERALRLKKGVA